MSEWIIREMKIEDLDHIMEIESLSFTIPWSKESFIHELNNNSVAKYYVAVIENFVAGYAGLWKIMDEGHITNIAVHPEYRNKRIGESLIKRIFKVCDSVNINKLTLEVRESNSAALKLYEKMGFQAEGIRKAYYHDNKEDAIIMWKKA